MYFTPTEEYAISVSNWDDLVVVWHIVNIR